MMMAKQPNRNRLQKNIFMGKFILERNSDHGRNAIIASNVILTFLRLFFCSSKTKGFLKRKEERSVDLFFMTFFNGGYGVMVQLLSNHLKNILLTYLFFVNSLELVLPLYFPKEFVTNSFVYSSLKTPNVHNG